MTRALAIAGVVALVAVAEADPDLVLKREPAPVHLKMRQRTAAVPPKPAPKPVPMPAAPKSTALAPDAGEEATSLRDVREPVSVQVNLGYQVDAAQPTGRPDLSGKVPQQNADFATLRSYAFGEAYFSSRGVAAESLSTYFATRFQLAQQIHEPQLVGTAYQQALPPPIATWFDRSGVETWAGWLEAKDFLPSQWGLSSLRLRAGEFYVYGPWVMHMYGGLVGWDGKIFTITAYSGSRVPDYTLALAEDRPTIAGISAKADLRGLSDSIPVTVGIEGLIFTQSRFSEPSRHVQFETDWRPVREISVIGQARLLDGQFANGHAQARVNYRQTTNFVFDAVYRTANDWQWDPSFITPDTDPTSARRYLDLGPMLPAITASVRGGTVVFDNINLLLRGAFSTDMATDTPHNNFTPTYGEIGGAVEVRLRRAFAVGVSMLARTYDRDDQPDSRIIDLPGTQILPATTALGERSFVEAGASMRMTVGARSFSALVEAYGRRTHYAEDYCLPDPQDPNQCMQGDDGVPHHDLRFGGRFTVDAWIGSRLRLFAQYELSSGIDFAPDIIGYKALKLMMEGRY